MDQTDSQRPVELAGARLPADHGLASLGLIMQMVGGLFFGLMVVLAMMPLFGGFHPGASWPLFLLGASGAVRAVVHRSAGTGLIYGTPRGHLHGVKVYLAVALVETAIWAYVGRAVLEMPFGPLAGLLVTLLAWPVALGAMLATPRLRRLFREPLPTSEDMGFEGAAVLMTIFGLTGLVTSATFALGLVAGGGRVIGSGIGILFLGLLALMVFRSALHLQAGVRGTRGIGSDGATEAVTRYASIGVVSSVVAGACFLVIVMMSGFAPQLVVIVAALVYFLLLWPLALRRYFMERNFAVMLAGDEAPLFRRAPDAGLTALGWLLLIHGAYGLATALAQTGSADSVATISALLTGSVSQPVVETPSAWWNVALCGLQLAAAIELVRMSDRHKLVTTVYGVASAAASIYLMWPTVSRLFAQVAPSLGSAFPLATVAFQLILPIAAIALVHRRLTPTAQARFKPARPSPT